MTAPIWTPLGSARLAAGLAVAPHGEVFPLDLVPIARAADLGEEVLHLAWELACLSSALRPELREADRDRRSVVLLLLLYFDALARGSSMLSLEPEALSLAASGLGLGKPDLRLVLARAESLSGASRGPSAQLSLELPAASPRLPYPEIFGDARSARPLVVEDRKLISQRMHALESRVAARLLDRAPSTPEPAALERALGEVSASGEPALTDEQASAVEAALRASVSVIAGGPGTGKTSIVIAILRALVRLDPAATFALAAPTGKAADRLTQSIARALATASSEEPDRALAARSPAAQTLHRLLAWSPAEGRFLRHEASPLRETLVIVDEASMIDVALMDGLLAALRRDARLVLLGDPDQLPSVSPGAVLADLLAVGSSPRLVRSRLTRSHRMQAADPGGAHILSIAALVREGRLPALDEAPGATSIRRVSPDAAALAPGVAMIATGETSARSSPARERFLDRWFHERIRGTDLERRVLLEALDPHQDGATLAQLLARIEANRLLCVTRGRGSGADEINERMARLSAREARTPVGEPLPGEPMMVTRNDYERGLYNGDTGIVLWMRDARGRALLSFVVRRAGGFSVHPLDRIAGLLERAYASTVHKAQGSEHDAIALVLPDEDVPRLLSREIVYTAITRARRSVLIVGPEARLADAIARPSRRESGLAKRLGEQT